MALSKIGFGGFIAHDPTMLDSLMVSQCSKNSFWNFVDFQNYLRWWAAEPLMQMVRLALWRGGSLERISWSQAQKSLQDSSTKTSLSPIINFPEIHPRCLLLIWVKSIEQVDSIMFGVTLIPIPTICRSQLIPILTTPTTHLSYPLSSSFSWPLIRTPI